MIGGVSKTRHHLRKTRGVYNGLQVETHSKQGEANSQSTRTGWISSVVAVVLIAAIGAAGVLLWQRFGPQPGPQYGIAINGATAAEDFRVDSTLGHPVSLSDYADRYTVLYFGYTTCPDICPTTLADLSKAETLLGDKAERMQVFFVTVDPERDTIDRMRDYLAFFSPTFVGLNGGLAETERIASQFGVVYEKRYVSESATDYLMDHTSAVVVLDPERKPLIMFPYGVTAEQMAADLRAVMR